MFLKNALDMIFPHVCRILLEHAVKWVILEVPARQQDARAGLSCIYKKYRSFYWQLVTLEQHPCQYQV